jgi:hypothetical protein
MKPLHTHDTSGNVHVEIPPEYKGEQPTIANFLKILVEDDHGLPGIFREYQVEYVIINGLESNIDYSPRDGDTITVSLQY